MSKIFVRQRRHIGQGAGRPRFSVIAVHGSDVRFKRVFLRQAELEKIAQETGAEIVYVPRGEQAKRTLCTSRAVRSSRTATNAGPRAAHRRIAPPQLASHQAGPPTCLREAVRGTTAIRPCRCASQGSPQQAPWPDYRAHAR